MNPVSKLKQKLTNLVSNAVSKVENDAIRIRKELPNIINLLYKVKIKIKRKELFMLGRKMRMKRKNG